MFIKVFLGLSLMLTPSALMASEPCDSRFTLQSNGSTILDLRTQLVWMECSDEFCNGVTWAQALDSAQTINTEGFAGESDWRVPNIKELYSIMELPCAQSLVGGSSFWSSSPSIAANKAYVLERDYLYTPAVLRIEVRLKSYKQDVLLVRNN